ncbi:hypothetical protein ACIBL3_33135 [Kribbella sp. NPDC050124]|uniref:hypothetical protein n=1 Tax=Kribbella sp. NPDC050124 TaxID=3364114 RepID=UPI0037956E54
MDSRTEITLRLTDHERTGLTALAAGLREVAESDLSEEDAMVAALELALTRLIEDFEVPDPKAREQVQAARDELRAHWVRGSATL